MNLEPLRVQGQVAGARTHDADEHTGFGNADGGDRSVRVNRGDGNDRRTSEAGEASALEPLGSQRTGAGADRNGFGNPRLEVDLERVCRVALARLMVRLMAGLTRAANFKTGELPDEPIARLDKAYRFAPNTAVLGMIRNFAGKIRSFFLNRSRFHSHGSPNALIPKHL